jgi:hypothetical protein
MPPKKLKIKPSSRAQVEGNKKLKTEQGATAILLVVFILSIILLVSLTAANIMVAEIKMSREIANSIPAFYAADAGAEQCLYQARKGVAGDACFWPATGSINITLGNGATAVAQRSSDIQITSSGVFFQTNRKIEIGW